MYNHILIYIPISPIGAHITIVNVFEFKDLETDSHMKALVGQEVSFQLKGVEKIHPNRWKQMRSLWIATFESERLTALTVGIELTSRGK